MKKKINVCGILAGAVFLITTLLDSLGEFIQYYNYSQEEMAMTRFTHAWYYSIVGLAVVMLAVSMFTKSRATILATYSGFVALDTFAMFLSNCFVNDYGGRYTTQKTIYGYGYGYEYDSYTSTVDVNLFAAIPDLVNLLAWLLLFAVAIYFVIEARSVRIRKTPIFVRVLVFLPIVMLFSYYLLGAVVYYVLDVMDISWSSGGSQFIYWEALVEAETLGDAIDYLIAPIHNFLFNIGLTLGVVACFKKAPKELPVKEITAE